MQEYSWLSSTLKDYNQQIDSITSTIESLKKQRQMMINFKDYLVGWGAEEEDVTQQWEGSD
jgi:hypothetical protein